MTSSWQVTISRPHWWRWLDYGSGVLFGILLAGAMYLPDGTLIRWASALWVYALWVSFWYRGATATVRDTTPTGAGPEHECVFVEEQEPSGRLILGPCLTCGTTALDALEQLRRDQW